MAAVTLHEDEMEVCLAKVHICRKHRNEKGGRVLLPHYWQ